MGNIIIVVHTKKNTIRPRRLKIHTANLFSINSATSIDNSPAAIILTNPNSKL